MTSRTAAATLAAACLLLAVAASGAASAGPPSESPRPMFAPWTAAAEQDGVEAVLTHAAGLGFMSRLELGLAVTTRLAGDEPLNSVLGLVGGRLGPLAVAIGLGGVGDGPGTESTTTRLDWGLALRLSDALSIGLGWQGLYNDADAALDEYGAWSLSTTLRPFRALALAIALDRFDTPKLGAENLNAILKVGLGIRPGTERITLGADFSHELGGDPWTLGGSVRFMLVPGLVLGGYGSWSSEGDEVRAGAFLGIYQGGLALESSLDVRDPDAGAARMSLTTMLKAKSARYPGLISDKRLLVKLPIGGHIPERTSSSLLGDGPTPFGQWIQALDVMAHDDDVAGVVLSISSAPSWGQSWELREALERLKAAGKKVYAVMTIGDMRAMYLASIADKVYLHAGGGLTLTGLAITRTYIATLLERLGVNVQIVKFEEYKAAPEALTRTGPSEPAKAQDEAILGGVMAAWMDAVTAGRRLTAADVDATLKAGPQSMKVALARGLVDGVDSNDAIVKAIVADAGEGAQIVERYQPAPRAWSRWAAAPTVAIVPIVGSIVDGSSAGGLPLPILGDETTGDESFVRAIEAAARDASVLGIVVRVDSGGGSATASDKMYRAVQLAADKKPLVVSFGDVAASGGYYAAAGAPKIFASPLTVTGSIGIFSGKADLSGLYALLGLSTSTLKTHERADMLGSNRPFTAEEEAAARDTLRAYYDRFVSIVADGRKLSMGDAYASAKGHVFLGGEALERKLIDEHGGLWRAIQEVRAQAGVDADAPLSLSYVGGIDGLSGIGRLVASVFAPAAGDVVGASVAPAAAPILARAQEILARVRAFGHGGPLALMPYTLEVQ